MLHVTFFGFNCAVQGPCESPARAEHSITNSLHSVLMDAAFLLAVGRRRQTWSKLSEVFWRCSSATDDLLRRRTRTKLLTGSGTRRRSCRSLTMSNIESAVGADAGGQEGNKIEEQNSVIAVGEAAVGGDNSQRKGAESEATHGFTRPEMHSEALVGSVAYYERHIFLSWKGPESWPSSLEAAAADSDGVPNLPNVLGNALKARKNDIPKKTRLTISAGQDGASDGDVFMFPDGVQYKGLTHVNVDSFVEDALVNGKEWKGAQLESLTGTYIFVCSHGSRDLRCGVCGPVLIEKVKEEIEIRGLEEQIFVRACSHVGGHKYAGNVIVFSSGTGSGHWYGYVSPGDVPLILDQHIGKGEIIDRLWRGEMGVKVGDQKLAQQNRLSKLEDGEKITPDESTDQVNGGKGCGAAGCCQLSEPVGKKSIQNPNVLQGAGSSVHDGHLMFFDDDEDTDEEPVDPRIPLWGSYYIPLPKWFGTWEKEDTNAALALLGATAFVALAIKEYRKSSA